MRFSLGTALGIEVHGPDLVLAVVRKGFRHFELQDHAVIEDFRTLPPGRLRERIRQSVRSYGTLKDRIVLGVPRDEAVVRWLELPLEVEENLDQMVQFQVERLEPTEENGSYYEYQVLEKDEATGKLLIQITMLPRATLDRYLEIRLRCGSPSDRLFVLASGRPVQPDYLTHTFVRLARQVGLRGGPGEPGPRLHDLRHSFAMRALESAARGDRSAISRHMLALSTYLGHANATDTYWYLEATPVLLQQVSAATERLHAGRGDDE